MRWPWQRRRELPPVPQVTEAVERRWMLPRTLIVLLSVIAVFAVLSIGAGTVYLLATRSIRTALDLEESVAQETSPAG